MVRLKSFETNEPTPEQFNFNSLMVRLKSAALSQISDMESYFNSLMVRLKSKVTDWSIGNLLISIP